MKTYTIIYFIVHVSENMRNCSTQKSDFFSNLLITYEPTYFSLDKLM